MSSATFGQMKDFAWSLRYTKNEEVEKAYRALESAYVDKRIKPLLARYRNAATRARLPLLDFRQPAREWLEAEFAKTAAEVEEVAKQRIAEAESIVLEMAVLGDPEKLSAAIAAMRGIKLKV